MSALENSAKPVIEARIDEGDFEKIAPADMVAVKRDAFAQVNGGDELRGLGVERIEAQ